MDKQRKLRTLLLILAPFSFSVLMCLCPAHYITRSLICFRTGNESGMRVTEIARWLALHYRRSVMRQDEGKRWQGRKGIPFGGNSYVFLWAFIPLIGCAQGFSFIFQSFD